MSTVLITIGIGFLILIGLVGIILPVLPDILLIWGAAMGYGWLMGWGENAFLYLAIISVLGLAALGAEVWMSGIGARIGGASLAATLGGLLLGIIGLVFLGPAGAAAGLLLGSFLIEYYRHRDAKAAIKGMLGIGVGYGSSLVVKLILGGGMALAWLVWVITG